MTIDPQASPIDFLIATPLAEERDAVLSRLPEHQQLPPTDEDIRVYYSAAIPVSFTDGTTGEYTTVVMPLAKMGHTEAATATGDAIRRWNPRFVLLVGIAGGMKNQNVGLGDVLIADQVADYELCKVTSEGDERRWEVHRVDQRLLIASQNYKSTDWHQTQARRYNKQSPDTHFGPICTGNKVVADESMAVQLQQVWVKHETSNGESPVVLAERDLTEAERIAERASMLIWRIGAAMERARLALVLGDEKQAKEKLDEARELIRQTEKPYQPHIPDWEDWDPPDYIGVFKEGDIVGYYCRNREIEALRKSIDQ